MEECIWFKSPCIKCMNRLLPDKAVPCVCCTRNPVGHVAAIGSKKGPYGEQYGCYEKDWYREVTDKTKSMQIGGLIQNDIS